jgi:hypothetical protein
MKGLEEKERVGLVVVVVYTWITKTMIELFFLKKNFYNCQM